MDNTKLKRRIRLYLTIFILGLVFSFQMTIFVEPELEWFNKTFGHNTLMGRAFPPIADWLSQLQVSITETYENYPVITYCMDWLAFAHIVLIVIFLGAVRNPSKNKWIIQSGIIACIFMIPFALFCGTLRGIPYYWLLIDCSFAVLGIIPLALAHHNLQTLEKSRNISNR